MLKTFLNTQPLRSVFMFRSGLAVLAVCSMVFVLQPVLEMTDGFKQIILK